MGSTGNGAKSGVLAGLVYGILLGVLSYFTILAEKSAIMSELTNTLPANSPFTVEQLYGIALIAAPAISAIGGVIGGIIIGAIYGRAFERIPGSTAVKKGIFVGLVLWFILSVLVGAADNLKYGTLVYLEDVGVGLISALPFGFLLGYFYSRFSRPPKVDPTIAGP